MSYLANKWKLKFGSDWNENVQTRHAARLRVAGQAKVVHNSLRSHRDLAHVRPGIALGWIEVDEQVVGLVHFGHARVPGVELDAPEVRDPRETGRVRDDGKVGLIAGRVV